MIRIIRTIRIIRILIIIIIIATKCRSTGTRSLLSGTPKLANLPRSMGLEWENLHFDFEPNTEYASGDLGAHVTGDAIKRNEVPLAHVTQ